MATDRWVLNQSEIPSAWFNIAPSLPEPLKPPLHPGTGEPAGPDDLAPLFPMSLVEQEMSPQEWIDIPGEVLDVLSLWRPTPLVRARRLEQALGTPAKIFYKDESVSPAGSHKPNTAVAQAFYNKAEGIKRLSTETGAGQWGSALSFAGAQYGLEVQVYMVAVSYAQKPYRRVLMETWGGSVVPSPSDLTEVGKATLAENPDHPGSLGLAISEAIEDAVKRDDTHYSLGSVLNHVLLHQTVIGLEAKQQLALAGVDKPDVVLGSCGGGSNLGGITLPFAKDRIEGADIRLVAVEPESCPTLTKGRYEYDFGDVAGMTPKMEMYTLGHDFVPPPIHAGGLRYHGDSPIISSLVHHGQMEAVAYPQGKVFEAAVQFARAEGVVPAPETSHAVRAAIDEALDAKEKGEERVILFNFSGHGLLDLAAYDDFLHGRLTDA
ncbi:MAG: TrpB-like pyridoxal phosphate-dependent enzyme [Actinobacteria bacterium ATB1]|nr:TrpB-like pyridoxal phosphate-dependent enzyme [Actinobacteria bacterium ATB1]